MHIKQIFVPVDFSDNAYQALDYAAKMAADIGAEVTVAHIFEVKVTPDGINMPPIEYIQELTEAKEREIKAYMQRFLEKIGHPEYKEKSGHVTFHTLVKEGFLVSELVEIARPEDYDLIIMGTKGANGIARLLWGSVTAEVMEKAKIPVLAIPQNAAYGQNGINKIVYATDLSLDEAPNIQNLQGFSDQFDAHLTCLHISTSTERVTEGAQRMLLLEEKFYFTPISKLDFKLLRGERVEKTLEDYLAKEQPEVIAMKPHQRNFVENLLHASMTRKMVLHTKVPLLTLK